MSYNKLIVFFSILLILGYAVPKLIAKELNVKNLFEWRYDINNRMYILNEKRYIFTVTTIYKPGSLSVSDTVYQNTRLVEDTMYWSDIVEQEKQKAKSIMWDLMQFYDTREIWRYQK